MTDTLGIRIVGEQRIADAQYPHPYGNQPNFPFEHKESVRTRLMISCKSEQRGEGSIKRGWNQKVPHIRTGEGGQRGGRGFGG